MTNRYEIAADKSELLDVLLRYCRAIDRQDYELLRSVYHPGAIDLHGDFFQGTVEEFIEKIPKLLETCSLTTHALTNALFVVDGDYAEGESYVLANHITRDDPPRNFAVSARYLDRFERRDGEWRISHRICVFDWGSLDEHLGPNTVKGRAGPDDKSYEALPLFAKKLLG